MKAKPIRFITLLLAFFVIIAFVLYQSGYFSKASPTPEALRQMALAADPGKSNLVPVRAQLIRVKELQDYILVSGSTVPAEEVMVSSEVPGKVKKILFKEGEWVKVGTPLVSLDDDELQAQRNRLVVQAKLTQKITERLKGLYEKQGVSLQEYEVAEAEYEKAQSDVALLNAQLEKRIVLAPFSGRLGLRLISEGSYLAPGTPIVPLVSNNPIKIEFSVPEKYSRVLDKGSEIIFEVQGNDKPIKARIEASDPTIDPDTRTYRFKASAPNPKGEILPGAFANIKVALQDYDATIMVPTEAIIPELGGKKVFVYRSGKAESISIETGIRQESKIQVIQGLQLGDTLITSGVLQIRTGTAVSISAIE